MSVVPTTKTTHPKSAVRLSITHFIVRKKKWFIILIAIGVSLLLINLMLQFFARDVLTQQLEKLGAHNPKIDSLSWSILRSNAHMKNVSWEQSNKQQSTKPSNQNEPAVFSLQSVRINWRWNSLLRKQIIIDGFSIQHLHTQVDVAGARAQWKIAGLDLSSFTQTKSDTTTETKPWPILVHRFNIQDMRLAVHQQQKQQTNLKLSLLAKHLTTSSNQSAFIVANLNVNESMIKMRGHTQHPARTNKNTALSISFDDLPISLIQTLLPANQSLAGNLGAQLKVEWLPASSSTQVIGTWYLKKSKYQQPNVIAQADFNWKGAITLDFDKSYGLTSIRHKGLLKSEKINVTQPESGVAYSAKQVNLNLDSIWKKTSDMFHVNFEPTSSLSLQGLKVSAKDLLNSETISLDQLDFTWQGNTTKQVTLTKASIQKLKILDSKSNGLFFNAQLDTATWLAQDNHLKIGNILIQDLEAGLQRTKENTIEPVVTLNRLNKAITSPAKIDTENALGKSANQTSSKAQLLEWEIESIAMSDQSHPIYWQDNFVDKSVKIKIEFTKARIEFLNLDQPSPWQLQWQSSPSTGVAHGTFNLKNNHWQANSSVKNVNLVPLSPYITQATGYGIDTGSTNISAELAANPYMQGPIKIKLRSLNLSTVNKRRASAFSKDLTMPLDLALSTLKNKKGDISFTVPIKIKNDASNVDIIPIINQALTRALRNAAISYLKYSLQPYGSILFLAEKANTAATALQLGAVEFEPGSAALTTNSSELLLRVAKMMRNRPNLRIKICTITNQADEEYFRAQPISDESTASSEIDDATAASKSITSSLDLIAEERKEIVQNRLIEKSDFASRIFDCRAKHSTSKKPARVEIQLTNS